MRVSFTEFHDWWRAFDDKLSFDSYDADNSGELSVAEMKALFREMGLEFEDLDKTIDEHDTDNTGTLAFQEFRPLSDLVSVHELIERLSEAT